MATHSSILAWEIPWTEEPGGLYWGHKESHTTEHKCCTCFPLAPVGDVLYLKSSHQLLSKPALAG